MGAPPPNPRREAWRFAPEAGAVLVGALVLAGCDAGPRDQETLNLPPVNVTGIQAATQIQVTADRTGKHAALVFGPVDMAGGSNVAPTTSFRVQFDRLLDPNSAIRASFCLEPILRPVPNANVCQAGIFLEPSYDPVQHQVILRQTSGNLVPETRYQLTIYGSASDTRIQSYDGVALTVPVAVEVGVLPFPVGVALPYDNVPTADHFCAGPDPTCDPMNDLTCVRSVSDLLVTCSFGGCHWVDPSLGPAGMASEGLMLGSPGDIMATAVNQVAHETQEGETPTTPSASGVRFGKSMPIIEVSNVMMRTGVPGFSYMLYKLLANVNNPLLAPFPGGSDPPEIERLRAEVVVGLPMPPSTQDPKYMPRLGELEWLSDWIRQGAPTPATCP